MVDVLLEATARILQTEGARRATTNEIARVAGVSVGSLYQYFPNKEALVAALIERKVELDLAELSESVMQHVERPLPLFVRGIVDAMIALHRRDRGLLRALLELVPQVGRYDRVRQLAAQGRELLKAVMAARSEELREGLDLEMAAFITGRAVEELIHAAVLEKPELLESEPFADELTLLLLRYLSRTP